MAWAMSCAYEYGGFLAPFDDDLPAACAPVAEDDIDEPDDDERGLAAVSSAHLSAD